MVKFLSKHEAMEWCLGECFALNEWGFPDVSSPEEKFAIPIDAQQRVALA